jgi:hypothetical protein
MIVLVTAAKRLPHQRRDPMKKVILRTALLICVLMQKQLSAEPPSEPSEQNRRNIAVTLNYCRAALHRIRRAPSKSVMLEEQQRILNNLDLNQIEDPDIISLYRSILDEIGQVEISDRERLAIEQQVRDGLQRKLGTDIFVIGAHAVTGQIGSVIQSGAGSWWDFRSTQIKRANDLWQVDKTQFSTFMSRSSTFLDSFWKLSRKNQIPDRWLLRDQDLDQLADVLNEPDSERRLRMLRRLEKFMECYPPYWYYVARTQQQMGELEAAAVTFRRLSEIGRGHFRQDDMLASCMANLSLIQETQRDPEAVTSALSAYDFSSRNWESNLVCAWVLGRHQRFDDAENLILCNLDDQLESDQSSVALVSLYYHSENRSGLAKLLDDDRILQRLPVPGLLLCARMLGPGRLPQKAENVLTSSIQATRRNSGRVSSIAVAATPAWKLSDANAEIQDGETTLHSAGKRDTAQGVEINFVTSLDTSPDSLRGETLKMTLNYPSTPAIHLVLVPEQEPDLLESSNAQPARRRTLFGTAAPRIALTNSQNRPFRVQEIEVDGVRLSFRPLPDAIEPNAEEERRALRNEYLDDDSPVRS